MEGDRWIERGRERIKEGKRPREMKREEKISETQTNNKWILHREPKRYSNLV